MGLSVALASAALAACQGCRTTTGGANGSAASASGSGSGVSDASVRLYLVSDVAGALEPCGCTKDQLGGLDHAAAWIHAQAAEKDAPAGALLVSAGPLFFMEPRLNGDHRDQDVAKAETIAESLKSLGFTAFAPGANEWAAGGAELGRLATQSGGHLLVANGAVAADAGDGAPSLEGWMTTAAGGVTVGRSTRSRAASRRSRRRARRSSSRSRRSDAARRSGSPTRCPRSRPSWSAPRVAAVTSTRPRLHPSASGTCSFSRRATT
jgi:2',3'-cyclic-nucleotide 2'-phosphodiesterase (5'-nucleotidase family)